MSRRPGRVRNMGAGMGAAFDPLKQLRAISAGYTDEKIVLARKLAREGYTYEQMAPLLGYKHGGGVLNYFRANNLPKPLNNHGSVHHHTEVQKEAQAQRMKEYWARTKTHQNDLRGPSPFRPQIKQKDGVMKITLPDWAEEAARLRAGGMSGPAIAKKLGVSDAYVYTTLNIISGKGTTNVPWAQDAIRMANEGKDNKEIAKIVGVTTNRVRDVLAQHEAAIQYRKSKEAKAAEGVAMSDRQFEPTHQTDNGATRNGVLIRCGVDGCHKVERFIRSHGAVHPVQAANYFRTKGWMIGGGPRADRCPDHAHRAKTAHHEPVKKEDMSPFHPSNNKDGDNKPETKPETKTEIPVDAATPPVQETAESAVKEMSKADRRIIFNKIEDVYGDETVGYRGDWSDDKVAEDLGVLVEWVALIRDENFGPAHNQAVALKETRKAGEEVMATITKMEAMKAAIEELSKDLKDKLADYIAIKDEFEAKAKEFTELYKTIAN